MLFFSHISLTASGTLERLSIYQLSFVAQPPGSVKIASGLIPRSIARSETSKKTFHFIDMTTDWFYLMASGECTGEEKPVSKVRRSPE